MAFVAGNTVTMLVVQDSGDLDTALLEAYNEAGIGRIRQVELDDKIEPLDGTVIGNTARKRQKGLEDWLLTCDIFFDTTADYTPTGPGSEGRDIKPGAQVTFRIRPTGSATKQWECDGIVESCGLPVVVDDLVKFTIVIRCSGNSVARTFA